MSTSLLERPHEPEAESPPATQPEAPLPVTAETPDPSLEPTRFLPPGKPKRRRRWPRALLVFAGLIAGLLLLYVVAIRPWHVRWGATDAEVNGTLPGDEIILSGETQSTRAITINAPASVIWPWLVQLGQDKAGFYSYEWLENMLGCNMHNAGRIRSEWQNIRVGDNVLMYPPGGGPPPYRVIKIMPGQALILGHPVDLKTEQITPSTPWNDTWAFVLQPLDQRTTRLVIRTRWTSIVWWAYMLEPGTFVMERGMMQGIKERAENSERGFWLDNSFAQITPSTYPV